MERQDFNDLVKACFEDCEKEMIAKSYDYQLDHDVFQNLEKEADAAGISVLRLLWIYQAKHMTALRKLCVDGEPLTSESFWSRVRDVMNYCILMYSYYEEEMYSYHEKERNACDERLVDASIEAMEKEVDLHGGVTLASESVPGIDLTSGNSPHPPTKPTD